MFEQAFINIDDILWKDDGVDAFLDQQQDMYRKYSSRVMQDAHMDVSGRVESGTETEQLPNVTENNWKNTGC